MTRSDLIASSRVSSIRQSYPCQIGVGKSDDAHWFQNQMGGENLTLLFNVLSDGGENLTCSLVAESGGWEKSDVSI